MSTSTTASRPRTSISQAAAKLAALVAPKGSPDQVLGRVLVEDEVVVASDSRRMIVIGEPHEDGIFSERVEVALVPCDALRDAAREATRVSVEHNQCTTLDDKGVSKRNVPFTTFDSEPWPNWRDVLPGHAPAILALDPGQVGDVFKQLASLSCTRVTFHKSGDLVVIEGELPNEQRVRLALKERDSSSDQLPGMPEVEKKALPEDGSGELGFERRDDTAGEEEFDEEGRGGGSIGTSGADLWRRAEKAVDGREREDGPPRSLHERVADHKPEPRKRGSVKRLGSAGKAPKKRAPRAGRKGKR